MGIGQGENEPVSITPEMVTREDLETLERLLPVPFVVFGKGGLYYTNSHFTRLTGYSKEELGGGAIRDIICNNYQETFLGNVGKFLRGEPYETRSEMEMIRKDGGRIWISYKKSLVDWEGEPAALAVIHDITESKEDKQALNKMAGLQEAMLEITRAVIGVVELDRFYHLALEKAVAQIEKAEVGSVLLRDGKVMKMTAHFGFKNQEIRDFQLPVKDAFIYKATDGKMDRAVIIEDISALENVYFFPLEKDDSRTIKSSITAPIWINGTFFGSVGVEATETHAFTEGDLKVMEFIRDNMEIAITSFLLQQEKHFLSQFDSLTGLYNRTFFEDMFEKVMEKARRYEETFQLAVVDLNDLKVVNDTLGHLAGDQLLRHFADHLRYVTRGSDILVRYGGDEFVCIFFYGNRQTLEEKLAGLRVRLCEMPMDYEGMPCACSFSFGISSFPEDGTSLLELIRIADRRMYRDKDRTKNQ